MPKRRSVPADHPPFAHLPVSMIETRDPRVRMAVHVSGSLADRHTPLVCLAGLNRNMSDFTGFMSFARRSAMANRPIVLIDLPGRGRADDRINGGNYSSLTDARDVADCLAALGIPRAIIIGQGHGGHVAMALTTTHPLLVSGTILVDAGPVVDSRGIVRLRNNLAHVEGLRGAKLVTAGFRRMLAGDYPGLPDDVLDRLAQRTHFFDKRGRAQPLYDRRLLAPLAAINFDDVLTPQWPLFDALAVAPLMILRTQLTDQLRRETFEEMVRRRPDALAFTISGQGSPALFDHTEEVTTIARFVTDIDAGKRRAGA